MERFSFLFLLMLFAFFPLLCLWTKYGKKLKKYKKTVLFSLFCCLVFGNLWQYLAIRNGVWGYRNGVLGIWFLGIPLEEHLFDLLFGTLIISLTLIWDKNG